jgi:hypothetical protein
MLASKEDEVDRLKGRKSTTPTASQYSPDDFDLDSGYESSTTNPILKKHTEVEREKLKEHLNIDYIKNVFIKYLEYQANNNEKEAMTLEKVLFTVLKANDKDIELIEKAR